MWTCRQAERLGLLGWVRNLPQGSVEVVARGSAHSIAALEALLSQGPLSAQVRDVEEKPAPVRTDDVEAKVFRIRST